MIDIGYFIKTMYVYTGRRQFSMAVFKQASYGVPASG